MAIAECNGIHIHYELHGTGYPLILISGLGGDHTFWNASLAPLSAHFRLITVDTRGICMSDAPEGPYSIEMFADDLAALMDHLELPAAHVLGFSMGGNIALKLAQRHPGRVGKLILAASHAMVPMQVRYFIDAVLQGYERDGDAKQMFALIAPWLFSERFLANPEHAAYLAYDENDPYPQPLHAWRSQYLAQRAFDMRGELASITQATLILSADEDPFAPLASAQLLHAGIAGSELRIVANSGHLMNFEQPERFHQEVLDFLGRE